MIGVPARRAGAKIARRRYRAAGRLQSRTHPIANLLTLYALTSELCISRRSEALDNFAQVLWLAVTMSN